MLGSAARCQPCQPDDLGTWGQGTVKIFQIKNLKKYHSIHFITLLQDPSLAVSNI